ncbi:MAG: glycosyltransferase N-terminal domain-containing protein [Chitinophagaceae bacterium]
MAVFFYNIFLLLFRASIHVAALFNKKAKLWVQGRKNVFERLQDAIPKNEKIIWVHCASLGEFEQGRPVIERLRKQGTRHKILLTFFSPSGYEIKKDYNGADWVFYLPLDGPKTAKKFLDIVHPDLVIFVKYEFWYYYLKKIKYRNIPLLLISALFRKDMSFFKWYGGLQRKMLSRFDHLFVQNASSKKLVDKIGLADISSISGDTRFDRVIEIAEKFEPIDLIEQFIGNDKVLVAGSTWPEDEKVLQKVFTSSYYPSLKLIIAPHDIDEKHLKEIKTLFPDSIFYSELSTHHSPLATCLIIDNVGMLSKLYKYGVLTYVGGGLRKMGVHNVLEAAVYNKIVLMGPFYQKYTEAVGLVMSGGGIPFFDYKKNGEMLKELIEGLLRDATELNYRSKAAGDFVLSNKGATEKIIQFIQEKRLLTN